MYGYIYKITNKVNNKVYIGLHKYNNPEIDPKYKGSGIVLQEAYKKYGEDNFSITYICSAETRSKLDELEKFYIQKYRDELGQENVYNIANGGQGGDIYTMTLKTRRKSGDALRGRKRDPEVIKRCAQSRVGYVVSEETRQKQRLSNIGQKRSAEALKHMSQNHADVSGSNNPFFKKKHSAEALRRIGEAAKGRNCNKRWITDGINTLLIDISKIPNYLDKGYKYGRGKLR